MIQNPKYFTHTQEYYRFLILKKIYELGSILLPIQSDDIAFTNALSKVHLTNLINDGVLAEKDEIIVLTLKGMDCLNRHYIDYQIDLISLSKNLGSFYKDKISELVKKVELPAALYGASDTLKSFFPFLKKSGLEFQCVIDDDPKKQNSQYLHLLVIDLRELTNYDVKTILISSIEFQNKIKDKIDSTYPNKYIVETIFD